MRALFVVLGALIVAPAIAASAAAETGPAAKTLNFTVMRNGEPIGTSTMRLSRDGGETVADIVTHIQVKIAYITVYRYDQSETERSVEADGKVAEVDPGLFPVSLWNASLLRTTMAINTLDGSVTPVSVVDHGEEPLVLQGRRTTAHHYSIKTNFPQDVWYDRQHQLLKVELRGSDGSRIQYQPG